MTEKRCSKCQQIKPVSEFYVDSHNPCGYRSACKICNNRFEYRRKVRAKIMEEYAMDVVGPFPQDLIKVNQERLIAAFKEFRVGYKKPLAYRHRNALQVCRKGLEFKRPTSSGNVWLHFYPPAGKGRKVTGKAVSFDLGKAEVPKIAAYIASFDVEIIFP